MRFGRRLERVERIKDVYEIKVREESERIRKEQDRKTQDFLSQIQGFADDAWSEFVSNNQ